MFCGRLLSTSCTLYFPGERMYSTVQYCTVRYTEIDEIGHTQTHIRTHKRGYTHGQTQRETIMHRQSDDDSCSVARTDKLTCMHTHVDTYKHPDRHRLRHLKYIVISYTGAMKSVTLLFTFHSSKV